jgi:RHS repeat-associated protein
MRDASGGTTYCYDRRGNPTSKRWQAGANLVFTTSYTYTRGDRLAAMTDPNGLAIHYTRDAAGRIVSLSRPNPNLQPIVTDVDYLPFGPASTIAFAGGATQTFVFDQNYWSEGVAGTALNLDFDLDATGNITAAHHPSPILARSYAYDPLARLTDIDDGNAALVEAYTFDATGNRLSKQTSGGTQTYAYPPDSHRLTAIDAQARSYDATGSLTVRGADTLTYDARQRLSALSAYGTKATYQHNGRGERVRKSVSGIGTTYFHYDEAGRLIAESLPSANGPVRRHSYVWLDDRPVAVYVHPHTPLTPTLPYANRWLHLHTDHLGTPRAITQPAANNPVVWRWDFNGSAFGDHAPLTDPDGDGIHFTFNLRFPGQYYDAESGLAYNYLRDGYEAGTGRYTQSDPIGMWGGVSTYAYVTGNPLALTDPLGLYSMCRLALTAAGATAGGYVGAQCGCLIGGVLAGGTGTLAAPGLGTIGGGIGGCGGGAAAGVGPGAIGGAALGNKLADEICDDDDQNCSKASHWQLLQAGITDAHAFKTDWGAVPNSRFDICACTDGAIVIKAQGACGQSGPSIPTGSRWK